LTEKKEKVIRRREKKSPTEGVFLLTVGNVTEKGKDPFPDGGKRKSQEREKRGCPAFSKKGKKGTGLSHIIFKRKGRRKAYSDQQRGRRTGFQEKKRSIIAQGRSRPYGSFSPEGRKKPLWTRGEKKQGTFELGRGRGTVPRLSGKRKRLKGNSAFLKTRKGKGEFPDLQKRE